MSAREIARDTARYSDHDEAMHHWSISEDGEVVSELWVSVETGEIMQVETVESHRGEGLARALYEQASREVAVFHAPQSHRTFEGDMFAQAVGGESLPCTHGCCTDDEEW